MSAVKFKVDCHEIDRVRNAIIEFLEEFKNQYEGIESDVENINSNYWRDNLGSAYKNAFVDGCKNSYLSFIEAVQNCIDDLEQTSSRYWWTQDHAIEKLKSFQV